MPKKFWLLGLIYFWWGWWMMIPNSKVKVIFCNVGQGDAAIVTSGYFQMLIDTGPVKGNVEKCLDENLPLGDKNLEIVMLSHNDADHIGDLADLKKYYKIGKTIGLGDVYNDDIIYGNNFEFRVIFPDAGLIERTNDSVVGILSFEGKNILFTGDIDELVEKSILNRVNQSIEVIKLSHHGSKTGNSQEWIQKINADFAIVSVGKNSYGHPSAEVIGRVLGVGTSVIRTDENGSLVVE